jgi:hypothetical protein
MPRWPTGKEIQNRKTTVEYATYCACKTPDCLVADRRESIVAVHGLDTGSPRTWIAYAQDGDETSRQVHWLQDYDMLPAAIPNARIFTYDWNADTVCTAAADDLFGHANNLLCSITLERESVSFARGTRAVSN